MELSYTELFAKFAENYWNLITKYNLRQMRSCTRYELSKIELIFQSAIARSNIVGELEFSKLSESDRQFVISEVTKECKRCVVGALYEDFEGMLYGFDLRDKGIWINPVAHEFMLKYKPEIEQLNYYAWAKFLEKINDDEVLVRVLGKLELATPRRTDLSMYRKLLQEENADDCCFYCGCKLKTKAHVDHVIPWSFVKEDHLWNFVLACPKCNTKKNSKVPSRTMLAKLIARNDSLLQTGSPKVKMEFEGYDAELLWRIWGFAKLSGIREFTT